MIDVEPFKHFLILDGIVEVPGYTFIESESGEDILDTLIDLDNKTYFYKKNLKCTGYAMENTYLKRLALDLLNYSEYIQEISNDVNYFKLNWKFL
jgi:hypothetical protein